MDLRWWCQPSAFGELTVVAGDGGIRRVVLPGGDVEAARCDAVAGFDERVAARLAAYVAGERHDPGVRADLRDVAGFRRVVLETLAREVPWGETVTYGELAELAGRPGAARAVGRSMATNPVPLVIPCHRVVAAGGRIGGFGGGLHGIELKRHLLEREGVLVG